MTDSIASLVEQAKIIDISDPGHVVDEHFKQNPSCKGIVVTKDKEPIGLIMRTHFYQMMGARFGHALYSNRSVKKIMKTELLKMSAETDLPTLGLKAMSRHEDDLYDFILVMDDRDFIGVISISNFLLVMSEKKQEQIELLNEQQKILAEAHEQEKRYSREIEKINKSINNLLNNADQGFLSFGEDGVILEQMSSVCAEIFGKEIAGVTFVDLMEVYLSFEDHNLMINTLASLFKQKKRVRAKTYLRLLPKTFKTNNRYIEISYKIIAFTTEKRIMVILTDVSDKKALEKKQEEEKHHIKLVLSALNNKVELIDAINDARTFFQHSLPETMNCDCPDLTKINELFRVVHTMKGDFALRAMQGSASVLHKLEDQLSQLISEPENISSSSLNQFKSFDFEMMIEKDVAIIKKFLGEEYFSSEKSVTINMNRLNDLMSYVETKYEHEDKKDLMHQLKALTYPTLDSIIAGYGEYIDILALKLSKKIDLFKVVGDTVYINREIYGDLIKSMIHIFRNIVDHGIETPEERLDYGKSGGGHILCSVKKELDAFTITISDDGKGISRDAIIEKVVAKGMYSRDEALALSEDQLLNTIFNDNFSTKTDVSMYSGRGVGLSAVKEEVDALKGEICVSSTLNEGTVFEIKIPYYNEKSA